MSNQSAAPKANDLAEALKKAEMDPLLREHLMKTRGVPARRRRTRVSVVPILFAVFLPSGVFLLSSAVMSFGVHCQSEALAWGVVAALVVVWFVMLAVARHFREHDPNPTWVSTLTLLCGLAIVGGTALGNYNFYVNYQPYCAMQDMQVAKNVNVSAESGQTYMDTGIFQFAPGTRLAASNTWHFKNGQLYCVAPLVGAETRPETGALDFWVVGKDCCSATASDFRCGAYDKPAAGLGGRRVMRDQDRLFYRLAVQQAESLYGIRTAFPIFMYYEENPLVGVNQWLNDSYNLFYLGLITCVAFALVAAAVASFCLSSLGRSRNLEEDWDPQPEDALPGNTFSDGMYYA